MFFSSSVHATEAQKRPLAVNTHVICVLLSDSVSLGYYSMRQIIRYRAVSAKTT